MLTLRPGFADGTEAFQMRRPLDCRVGIDCVIQHYVDRAAGTAVRDHSCGYRTNDGHNGTDFRVPDLTTMRHGVDVLAVADGQVLRVRDQMDDVSVRTVGPEALNGKECGNGLVIRHKGGWETQYCHLRLGSITVRPGQDVNAGETIGQVGLSGLTEFPHLHLTVRHGRDVIDPFGGETTANASGNCILDGKGEWLWDESLRDEFAYTDADVLNFGFTERKIGMADIESGLINPPDEDSEFLIAYARAIGLQAGDIMRFQLRGPSGEAIASHTAEPLESNKAQYFRFIGRKKPASGWPLGTYTADFAIVRNQMPVVEQSFSLELRDSNDPQPATVDRQ